MLSKSYFSVFLFLLTELLCFFLKLFEALFSSSVHCSSCLDMNSGWGTSCNISMFWMLLCPAFIFFLVIKFMHSSKIHSAHHPQHILFFKLQNSTHHKTERLISRVVRLHWKRRRVIIYSMRQTDISMLQFFAYIYNALYILHYFFKSLLLSPILHLFDQNK